MKSVLLIGERFVNNKGYSFQIIGYKPNNYRIIQFDSGYICDAHMSNIKENCKIKDWLSPSILGKGIVGAPYLRKHPLYTKWKNMIHRCYNEKFEMYKYYGALGIIMSEELLNFQTFITIVESLENYKEMLEKPSEWHLDKDLKSIDKKIYSKDTLKIINVKENQWLATEKFHKKIYQYDLKGTLIKQFDSLIDVRNQTGFDVSCINHAIKGRYRHAYNYIWLNEENLNQLRLRIKTVNAPYKSKGKKVVQLDKNTKKVIKEYDSVSEACNKNKGYKSSNITGCCRGEQNTAYGYIWKYKEE